MLSSTKHGTSTGSGGGGKGNGKGGGNQTGSILSNFAKSVAQFPRVLLTAGLVEFCNTILKVDRSRSSARLRAMGE